MFHWFIGIEGSTVKPGWADTHGILASMDARKITIETLQVLATMAARPNDRHYGLELAEEAGLPKGSIYPMLARLQQRGLLKSEWEQIDETEAGRRRRRYYTLTAEGARTAVFELDRMRKAAERVGRRMPELRRLFPGLRSAE